MKDNLLYFSTIISKWLLAGLVLLVPIFFLTTNFDYYEYPKQVLIWTVTLALTLLWLVRFALSGKSHLKKTPLDVPLLAFLVIVAISTYLSVYKYTAIMGTIGRPHPGLVSFVSYSLLLYIGLTTIEDIKDLKRLVYSFIIGNTLLALCTIFQLFGLFDKLYLATKFSAFLALKLTNPAASGTSASVTMALAVPVVLGWMAYNKKQRGHEQEFALTEILMTLAIVLMASVVVIYNTIPAWITLFTGLIIFAFWNKVTVLKEIGTYLGVATVVLVVIALLVHLPFFTDNLKVLRAQPAKEIQLGMQDSWVVAVHTVRDRPFFGSGFGSFPADFTRYRQVGFNLNPNWNIRFNSSFNDYFNYLAMVGMIGLLAWVVLIYRYSRFAFAKALKNSGDHEHTIKVGMAAATLAFFVGTLFTNSTTAIFFTFLFTLLASLAIEKVAGGGLEDFKLSGNYGDMVSKSAQPIVILIPGIIIIAFAGFFGGKTVLANYYYRQALNSAQLNQPRGVLLSLPKAIRLDPYVDLYHSEYARSSFVIGAAIARQENLDDKNKALAQALVKQAVDQAAVAAKLDPLNVGNWEALAGIYRSVSGTNQQILQSTLQALQQAIQLDPANPQLRIAIGGIFFAAGQYNEASQIFAQAVQLKPDFANARYNLANAYVKMGEYNKAYLQYEEIKKKLTPGSADFDKVTSEQQDIKDKITVQTPSPSTPTNEASASAKP